MLQCWVGKMLFGRKFTVIIFSILLHVFIIKGSSAGLLGPLSEF
jgi:hypothetical protein